MDDKPGPDDDGNHDERQLPEQGLCREGRNEIAGSEDSRLGFYLTFYLSGYGSDATEARARWNVGLKLVENALLQLSVRQKPLVSG